MDTELTVDIEDEKEKKNKLKKANKDADALEAGPLLKDEKEEQDTKSEKDADALEAGPLKDEKEEQDKKLKQEEDTLEAGPLKDKKEKEEQDKKSEKDADAFKAGSLKEEKEEQDKKPEKDVDTFEAGSLKDEKEKEEQDKKSEKDADALEAGPLKDAKEKEDLKQKLKQDEDALEAGSLKYAKEELNRKPDNVSEALELVLHHVGDMGRYQICLFLLMMPFGMSFAYLYFVQMFITMTPHKHWCKVPELAHLDMDVRRNLSAPASSTGDWDKCSTFKVKWTEVLATMTPPPPGTPKIPCPNGWDFEMKDIPYATVVTERGWVCEKASYVPLAQSVFFLGAITGGLFFGWLADYFGRVPALVGCNLIGGIFGILTTFTEGMWDFVLCRFFVGMAYDNAFMMAYILVLEYVSPRLRTKVVNLSVAMFYGSGCVSLPWLALWLKDWRKLLWITSTPMFLALFVPYIVPESARWYVSRGRVDEAVLVLRKFERVNHTKVPDNVMADFIMKSHASKQGDESLLVLFRNAPLRLAMILMTIVYMATNVIYDGLIRLSDSFGLDFFISFSVSSATEIPSVTVAAFALDTWGRRNLTYVPMVMSGILVIIAIFVPRGIPLGTLSIIARFCINMPYTTMVQWATELLPTTVRASGSSAYHIFGHVAAMISPYIVFSERLWIALPLLIFGIVALVAAAICLTLPETMGRNMPQTMADGEQIVREQPYWGKAVDDAGEGDWRNEKRALIT